MQVVSITLANVDDPGERAIAQLLVTLGRELGLDVVAEGIETRAQLRIAEELGCTHGQGYLIGRPMPLPIERLVSDSVPTGGR